MLEGLPGLKKARKNARKTQVELAIRLGVQPTSLARWEQGTRSPDAETVGRIAKILGVEPQDLTGSSSGAA